jgi:hypothetical protein
MCGRTVTPGFSASYPSMIMPPSTIRTCTVISTRTPQLKRERCAHAGIIDLRRRGAQQ